MRANTRDAHLDWLRESGRVVMAGPLVEPASDAAGKRVGSLLIVNGDDLDEVQSPVSHSLLYDGTPWHSGFDVRLAGNALAGARLGGGGPLQEGRALRECDRRSAQRICHRGACGGLTHPVPLAVLRSVSGEKMQVARPADCKVFLPTARTHGAVPRE